MPSFRRFFAALLFIYNVNSRISAYDIEYLRLLFYNKSGYSANNGRLRFCYFKVAKAKKSLSACVFAQFCSVNRDISLI